GVVWLIMIDCGFSVFALNLLNVHAQRRWHTGHPLEKEIYCNLLFIYIKLEGTEQDLLNLSFVLLMHNIYYLIDFYCSPCYYLGPLLGPCLNHQNAQGAMWHDFCGGASRGLILIGGLILTDSRNKILNKKISEHLVDALVQILWFFEEFGTFE
ncbi:hypothetical protein ACJX0J_016733, partial [Zea mays]